jgi:hypothetical protein
MQPEHHDNIEMNAGGPDPLKLDLLKRFVAWSDWLPHANSRSDSVQSQQQASLMPKESLKLAALKHSQQLRLNAGILDMLVAYWRRVLPISMDIPFNCLLRTGSNFRW